MKKILIMMSMMCLFSSSIVNAIFMGTGIKDNASAATFTQDCTDAANMLKTSLGTRSPKVIIMIEALGIWSADLQNGVAAIRNVFSDPNIPVFGCSGVTKYAEYNGYTERSMTVNFPLVMCGITDVQVSSTMVTFGMDWWNVPQSQWEVFGEQLGNQIKAMSLPPGNHLTIIMGTFHGSAHNLMHGQAGDNTHGFLSVVGDTYPVIGASISDGAVYANGGEWTQWNAIQAVVLTGDFYINFALTPYNVDWSVNPTPANHQALLTEEKQCVQQVMANLPPDGVCKGLLWWNCNGRHSPPDQDHLDSVQSVFGVNLPIFGWWAGNEIGKPDNDAAAVGDGYRGTFAYIYNIEQQVATKLGVSAYPTTLTADGTSLATVTAEVLDANNNLILDSTAEITFNIISGPGTLEGTNPVNASGGIARITYRSGTTAGTATIEATSPGLQSDSISIPTSEPTNDPPSQASIPAGSTSVMIGVEESYSTSATDPNGDQIYYTFDWGDGSAYTTTSLVNSGVQGNASHSWSTGGTYYVRAHATDSKGTDGIWSESLTVTVPGTDPVISVDVTILDFGQVQIGTTKTLDLTITNTGGGILNGTIVTNQQWIEVQPTSFNGNNVTVNVTVDNSVLNQPVGQYTGIISITSNGGNVSVEVTLVATSDPLSISVNPATLDFGNVEIGETATLNFNITSTGAGILSGTITADKKWIEVQPTSFVVDPVGEGNTAVVEVTVDNSILNQPSGQYTGTVSITSNGGDAEVEVELIATCILAKPNPYDPTKGPMAFFGDGIVPGETTIRIYTLDGELIKTLSGDSAKSRVFEGQEVKWDGKNEDGEEITNGIYIYVYESPNEQGVGKFTVIRQ